MEIEVDEWTTIMDIKESDAANIFAIIERNRKYLRQFLGWIDFSNCVEDIQDFIAASQKMAELNNGGNYLIRYRGEIAGMVSFNQIDWINHRTSIGYWLVKHAQGKGIMTSSVHALIEYAFNVLGLNRVEIRCATVNRRSQAIAIRLGFKWEGRIREAEWLSDRYVDHHVYGLLKREWNR
ncbi:GNAT family N-acetyltransferase [Aneurinibacillus terranovensis]|uniref:GNAT family N-acetyltransferase n=1 Tax=Aneurinibacillus terranovensis TaxID=278991 RepID=UPI000400EE91|nr:GNAT family N-acetyltransferase [Aneurinibacillus terranovensis]